MEPLWETEARAGPKLAARARLLEAAANAFMNSGYAETTLDDVAALTGMTKGQIYHYYRSKIDLYFDVVVGAYFILNEAVLPLAEQPGASPTKRLRDVAYRHTMVLIETFPFQKVALDAAQHRFRPGSNDRQSRAMERVFQFRDEYEKVMVDMIAKGGESGEFAIRSPAVAAKAVLGALNWLLVWYDPLRPSRDEDRHVIAQQSSDYVVASVTEAPVPIAQLYALAVETSESLRQMNSPRPAGLVSTAGVLQR